jgi:microcystin-dependent protein
MKNCSNCFNGCTNITSDQCVRYTGVDVDVLGIKNGDSLSFVEQALVGFLTSVLDGTGIKIDITEGITCDLVSQFLSECDDVTLVDLIEALIKASCRLQEEVDSINQEIDDSETDFDIDCLQNVLPSDNVHNVLQTVIHTLCTTNNTLEALVSSLETDYVKLVDLDELIQDYLDSISQSSLMSSKMIPYTAVEYYGPLTQFDLTGAGTGAWTKIYLCNGNNGTPDKRGRVAIGTTNGMGGAAFDAAVDPAILGNPQYALNAKGGANNITLTIPQLPIHAHSNTATISPNPHMHSVVSIAGVNANNDHLQGNAGNPGLSGNQTGLTILTVTLNNASVGQGQSHSNIQPVLACHYIMYIP